MVFHHAQHNQIKYMSEKNSIQPSIQELAHIAAHLNPQRGREKDAIQQAMLLWREAECEIERDNGRTKRDDYLKDIEESIYTATPEEWQARLLEFRGEQADVQKLLTKMVDAE